MSVDVSIIVPTFFRPEGLERAVRSLFAQLNPFRLELELVVVDNDPAGGARAMVERLQREAPYPTRYIHAAEPGVANARNAGIAASSGALIAFLDDDEEANPTWLCELVGAQRFHDADAVFGPVRARVPDSTATHHAYYTEFFSRSGPEESGPINGYYGCGNSLIRRSSLPAGDMPFDAQCNAIGGEDDLLFAEMQQRHARFVWCREAPVWEDPSPSRVRLAYTLRRAFAYGQGTSAICAARSPRDLPGVVFWMLVGIAQLHIYGLLALVLWMVHSPARARMLDRAVRGLGKVFWWGPFKQEFYGVAGVALMR